MRRYALRAFLSGTFPGAVPAGMLKDTPLLAVEFVNWKAMTAPLPRTGDLHDPTRSVGSRGSRTNPPCDCRADRQGPLRTKCTVGPDAQVYVILVIVTSQ